MTGLKCLSVLLLILANDVLGGRDFYKILGVSKRADTNQIKKAYRKVAIKYHPDKNPDNKPAEEKFKEAAEAYEVLSNPEKKQKYDRFGHDGLRGGPGGFSGGGMNVEDIFEQFGDVFGGGSPFDSFFGGGRSQQRNKGTNLRIKLKLSIQEIASGIEKKIKVKRLVTAPGVTFKTCNVCNGSGKVSKVVNTMLGQMVSSTVCHHCNGTGQIIDNKPPGVDSTGLQFKEEIIKINIPSGVGDGMQLSMTGKGNESAGGGISGDLLILIEEKEDDNFKRDGNNVVYDLYINFTDAALGNELEVPTLSGKVKIKIPPGTQGGKIFRLRGKGIKDLNSSIAGDQLIHVNIWTPKKLTQEEEKILSQLKNSKNFKPSPGKSDKGFFEKVRDFMS